ncbi:GyrI-like domain-containing protein [Cohnella luojiensis]|uniref:AraC family transcriptional regulator n=1 Tax=Cohnella luojiensis TaxID=652876 RepID=A0A4Y8M082_9BACL|nr:GyrI-like domain-containing protein [Cohnella luojiensis]TFE27253.1 AraC family transcriptional regulator [Cohnella luojiensis]
MEPSVVQLEEFGVVGVTFTANLKEIVEEELGSKAAASLKSRADEVMGRVGDAIYLVQIYPMKENFNPNVDRFTQIIGYKVIGSSIAPTDMIHHVVPANRYVKCTHKGLESELGRTYDFLYGTYVGQLGTHPVGYDFEIMDERFIPDSPDNEIDLHIAIA